MYTHYNTDNTVPNDIIRMSKNSDEKCVWYRFKKIK